MHSIPSLGTVQFSQFTGAVFASGRLAGALDAAMDAYGTARDTFDAASELVRGVNIGSVGGLFRDLRPRFELNVEGISSPAPAVDSTDTVSADHTSDYFFYESKWREFIFKGQETHPEVRRTNVVGTDKNADDIQEHALALRDYKELMKFDPPPQLNSGLLLIGRPGTGKTYLSHFLATESGARFIEIADFPHFGDRAPTRSSIRALFEVAREYVRETGQPIVLSWDDIDKFTISDKLSHADTRHAAAVAEFTRQLSGTGLRRNGILVVATTNMPGNIPLDMKRKGRLGHHYHTFGPDRTGLKELLISYVKKNPHAEGIDYDNMSHLFLPGTVAGDVDELVKSAYLAACQEQVQLGKLNGAVITEDILINILLREVLQLSITRHQTQQQIFEAAIHEIGHVVVARKLGIKVPLVTVLCTEKSFGQTKIVQSDDRHETIQDRRNEIACFYAGRLSEELCGLENGPSIESDLERASASSVELVEALGEGQAKGIYSSGGILVGRDRVYGNHGTSELSEETLREQELDAKAICIKEHDRARRIIEDFGRARVEWLARQLAEKKYILERELDLLIEEAETLGP
jgi:ATP-dependent Zn protease